jgi:hypothetical protein
MVNRLPDPESNNQPTYNIGRRISLIAAATVAMMAAVIAYKKRNDPDGVVPMAKQMKEDVNTMLEENRRIVNAGEASNIYRRALRARYLGGKTKPLNADELVRWLEVKKAIFERKYSEELEQRRNQNMRARTKKEIEQDVLNENHPEID